MNTKYLCQFDGSIFSTEDELIKYIREKYVTEFKDKTTDVSEVYDVLNQHFSDWKINIENGAGWYAGYIIHLEKERTIIEQHYDNEKSESDRYYTYKGNPDTSDDLVKEIEWKIETAHRMTENISKIGDFEDVYCKEFDYGYSPDEHHFTFYYKLREWDDYGCECYYPWSDRGDENYFINDFRKLFVKNIEGKVGTSYDRGHFNGYSIDGICINDLFTRAKKAHLEILE